MTRKRFNGKAIYQPKGAALEYAPWACNFYTGCSNDCEYCYCKRGVMSHVWSTEPRLKKCFNDESHALEVFKKELTRALCKYPSIKERGILFSFTTDPMIPGKTFGLTMEAMWTAVLNYHIPVQILTKRVDWLDRDTWKRLIGIWKRYSHLIAFGFTLTGFDEKEPGASTNQERIGAMRELHGLGFKTFASIEPIIDPMMSLRMIEATEGFCDLYKVGLMSGKGKDFYDNSKIYRMYGWLLGLADKGCKFYLKDSFLEYIDIPRYQLTKKFVNSDYNIFND